jgi:hypothetical protein
MAAVAAVVMSRECREATPPPYLVPVVHAPHPRSLNVIIHATGPIYCTCLSSCGAKQSPVPGVNHFADPGGYGPWGRKETPATLEKKL